MLKLKFHMLGEECRWGNL